MWHWSGWKKENLNWAPASKITRFKSGICGISTDGKLLVLLNDNGTIRSSPLTNLPNIHGVQAIGGIEEEYVWGVGVLFTMCGMVMEFGRRKKSPSASSKRVGCGY